MGVLRDYERELGARLIAGLPEGVRFYGPPTMEGRVPTFLFNVDGRGAEEVARTLGERGYRDLVRRQLVLRRARRAPAEQSLRAGLIHYNTRDEVDRLLAELASL